MVDINKLSYHQLEEINYTMSQCDYKVSSRTTEERNQLKKKLLESGCKDAYDRIITKTTNFIQNELNIKNDVFLAIAIFSEMLRMGIFSKDKIFKYSPLNRKNNESLLGADIMLGHGVCLNISAMLTDVFKSLNIENYLFICDLFLDDDKLDSNNMLDNISNKFFQQLSSLDIETRKKYVSVFVNDVLGNHAVNLFKNGERYYIADPTNLLFLNITDYLKASAVGKNAYVNLKIFYTLLLNEHLEKNKLKNIILETYLYSDEEKFYLKENFVNETYQSSKNICRKNHFLLDDFHDDNIEDIDIVCKKLTK